MIFSNETSGRLNKFYYIIPEVCYRYVVQSDRETGKNIFR